MAVQKVIGLDIGSSTVKMIEIDRSKKYTLDFAGIAPLPDGVVVDKSIKKPDIIRNAINSLYKNSRTSSKKVATSLAGKSVIIKQVSMSSMGDIQLADSHIDRAVEAYSRALNIDPNNFDARGRRAKLYMEVNNFTQAVADLEHAAKVNAYSGEVYELRARCYETLGDNEKARQDQWKARVFAHR